MRILPQILTSAPVAAPTVVSPSVSPSPAAVSPEVDHELRLLKERVQALEVLSQLKTDVEAQAQAMAAVQKTFESLEGRLHSCEEAPRLLAVTFMQEVDERVRREMAGLEKKITERLEKLPIVTSAPPMVEKAVSAPVAPAVVKVEAAPIPVVPPNWESRFESHEKVLAELMKEIAVVAMQPAPVVVPTPAAKAPAVTESFAPLEIPKPFETSAPDRAAEHSLDIAWTANESLEPPVRQRSLATRLWYYLNAPAFSDPSEHDSPDSK